MSSMICRHVVQQLFGLHFLSQLKYKVIQRVDEIAGTSLSSKGTCAISVLLALNYIFYIGLQAEIGSTKPVISGNMNFCWCLKLAHNTIMILRKWTTYVFDSIVSSFIMVCEKGHILGMKR